MTRTVISDGCPGRVLRTPSEVDGYTCGKSVTNYGSNAFAFMHQVEGVINFIQAHGMRDKRFQIDITFHRIFNHAR